MASITALGGAAPPVATSIVRLKLAPHLGRRVHQHVEHDRRPAQMGHARLLDQREDHRRVDLAQADMRAADRRHRPGVGPAVAVEHGQGPEIAGPAAQPEHQRIAHGVQEGAAMVVDHALRVAGRARGVVERDRVPLVRRPLPGEGRIALGQQRLVVHRRLAARRGPPDRRCRSPPACAGPAPEPPGRSAPIRCRPAAPWPRRARG